MFCFGFIHIEFAGFDVVKYLMRDSWTQIFKIKILWIKLRLPFQLFHKLLFNLKISRGWDSGFPLYLSCGEVETALFAIPGGAKYKISRNFLLAIYLYFSSAQDKLHANHYDALCKNGIVAGIIYDLLSWL